MGGGESGIRTHGRLATTRDFQSRPIGHSGISPCTLTTLHGGEGGIRTHDGIAPIPVFETGALNRSATSPRTKIISWQAPLNALPGLRKDGQG